MTRCFFVAWRFVAQQRSCGTSWRKGKACFAGAVARSPYLSLSPWPRAVSLLPLLEKMPNVEVWRCKLRQTRSTLIPITLYNAWQFFTAWSSHAVPITKCTSFHVCHPPRNYFRLPFHLHPVIPQQTFLAFPPVNTDINEATFVRHFQVHGGQFGRPFQRRTALASEACCDEARAATRR